MAGKYGRKFIKDEDFEEGDIWNIIEEKENSKISIPKIPSKKLSDSSSRYFSTTPRMIPRSSSSTNENAPSKQFSAPVDIPDWSKIYGMSSKKKQNNNFTSSSSSSWVHVDHHYYSNDGYDDHNHDNDDDNDDDGMVPPHEFLARKLARSQISSFSVFEGIGRTLKGRDLSKLRNTILTKTGFLE